MSLCQCLCNNYFLNKCDVLRYKHAYNLCLIYVHPLAVDYSLYVCVRYKKLTPVTKAN